MARVLVIEDQAPMRLVVTEVLRGQGHHVVAADDGVSGLALLEQPPPPELVLMDLHLPRAGGRQVLAQLRRDPRWRALPVVLMTGLEDDATDFPPRHTYQALLKKPFDLQTLTGTVRALLDRC